MPRVTPERCLIELALLVVAAVVFFGVVDLFLRGPSSRSGADRLLLGVPHRNLLVGYLLRYDRIVHTGIAARGVLLSVNPFPARAPRSGRRRFQVRTADIDIEIPGRQPYEIQARLIVPSRMVEDVLPGATLEIRIDRWNSRDIAVIGPGAGIAATSLLAAPPPS